MWYIRLFTLPDLIHLSTFLVTILYYVGYFIYFLNLHEFTIDFNLQYIDLITYLDKLKTSVISCLIEYF